MWPEGKLRINEVTKRPLTAATLFKNSMIMLVENLACKVSSLDDKPFVLNTHKPLHFKIACLRVSHQVLNGGSEIKHVQLVINTVSHCRNPTMCAASSPTRWSRRSCSSRSAAATRWSTSGCWRTSECGVPASPTDRPTLASYRGTCHILITLSTCDKPCFCDI